MSSTENSPFELSEQDQADLDSMYAEPDAEKPPYRTVLEAWKILLFDAVNTEGKKRVTPGWASRVTSLYKQLKLQEMNVFRDIYFAKINELRDALVEIIDGADDEALKVTSPAEDVERNSPLYRAVVFAWQTAILKWELAWDCEAEDAHVEIATISEVHRMFFGENGVTGHLDAIGFQFTEDDGAELTAHLDALKAESGE